MKKYALVFPLSALTLFSCGGNIVYEDVSAFEICQKINPKAKDFQKADTLGKTEFLFYLDGGGEDGLDRVVRTNISKIKSGGYLVLYQETDEGTLGDAYFDNVTAFKTYFYKDGALTEKSDLLPKPGIDVFKAADGLVFLNRDAEFSKSFNNAKYEYRTVKSGMISAEVSGAVIFYDWDGKNFVLSASEPEYFYYDIISTGSLGGLKCGEVPPETLSGYEKTVSSNTVTFSYKGKKAFSLSLKDGKTDTITVFSERYTYPICATGGCSSLGVGFNGVDDGFGIQYNGADDYFIFKDGVWVRVVGHEGGFVEFYTTKNALTVKPDNGKIVRPSSDDPWSSVGSLAKYEATVSLIKIYRQGGFCETCSKNSDDDNVAKIRKMYNETVSCKDMAKKSVQVEDEESGMPCGYDFFYKDGKLSMVEFSTGDGTYVDMKIYLENGYAYFALVETTFPDNTKTFERIYLCAGKIFKYLDNNKKDVSVNSDEVVRAQININSIVETALKNENRAK